MIKKLIDVDENNIFKANDGYVMLVYIEEVVEEIDETISAFDSNA